MAVPMQFFIKNIPAHQQCTLATGWLHQGVPELVSTYGKGSIDTAGMAGVAEAGAAAAMAAGLETAAVDVAEARVVAAEVNNYSGSIAICNIACVICRTQEFAAQYSLQLEAGASGHFYHCKTHRCSWLRGWLQGRPSRSPTTERAASRPRATPCG